MGCCPPSSTFGFEHIFNRIRCVLACCGGRVIDAAGGQNVIAGYQSLFSGIGKFSQCTSNQIDRSDYGSGYTLFAFDLTSDHCLGDHFELTKQANLRLELYFSEALANTVNLVVYAESERQFLRLHKLKMDTTQLNLTLRKDKFTRDVFKACIPQTSCL